MLTIEESDKRNDVKDRIKERGWDRAGNNQSLTEVWEQPAGRL